MKALALTLASLAWTAPARASVPATAARSSAPAPGAISTEDRRRTLLLVELLIEEKRFDEADAILGQRLAVEPSASDLLGKLARVRGAEGRHADAARLYAKLLSAQPDDPGLLLSYGEQLEADGRPGEARRAYERAYERSRLARPAYYLSELAYSRGDDAEGRRWAERALARLKAPQDLDERKLSLRLRSRLSWSDQLDEDYARLFAAYPGDAETLAHWADALLRWGYPEAAGEPLRLLRERFPEPQPRWRLLEAERLRALGDERAQLAFLRESAAAVPAQPSLRLALASLEYRRRDWDSAEADARVAASTPTYARAASALAVESMRRGHHFAGPFVTWRETVGTRSLEVGASYAGYPWRRWRLESEASRGEALRYATSARAKFAGGAASLVYDAPRWAAGGDLDVRASEGRSDVSPGLIAAWQPGDRVDLAARAWTGRLWKDSADALLAGVKYDAAQGTARYQATTRLSASMFAQAANLTAPAGGHAKQSQLAPQLGWELLGSGPGYATLVYRFAAADAVGDGSFFASLPLVRRSRVQYLELDAGRRWLDGRLRLDGYAYNGHEPERGRRFFTSALVGFGAKAEYLVASWRLMAAYDHTKEDELGVGGHSDALRLWAQWRWAPRRAPTSTRTP